MVKKAKKPKTAVSLVLSKTPSAEPVRDFNKLHPAWRIASLEMCDPYGWHELDQSKLNEIRERLSHWEKLTWNEILVLQKKWNHTVPTASLKKRARDRLTALGLDASFEEITSLRLTGRGRIWGFRVNGAMTLLWWDSNHDVWDDGT